MFVVIVILVVSLAFLLATVWRVRHRSDPMRERERAFATLRRMAESPRVQLHEMAERLPVDSGHVRILSERPTGSSRPRRQRPARRARASTQRRRTLTPAHPTLAVIPTSVSVTSLSVETKSQPDASPDADRTTSPNPARVTLLRGEPEPLRGEITTNHPTGPEAVEHSGNGSRSRRRAGGSDDALDAAVKRALNHADGMADQTRNADELTERHLKVTAKSA